MTASTQRAKAETFRSLHDGSDILVLPCAWDAASARLFEEAGFPALGTTSAGIANSLGYPDGQHAPLEEVLAAIERIADAVSIPVSADFESGYAASPNEAARNVHAALEAGVVGVNLEDGTWPGADPLVDPAIMVETIEAIRELAAADGIPLVVNARTDIYLHDVGEPATRFDRAVERANTYYDAGADCLFVPGVTESDRIGALSESIGGPINILASQPEAPPVPELEQLGVARVSVGPGPMYATLGLIQRLSEELLESGTYVHFEDAMAYPDVQGLFTV